MNQDDSRSETVKFLVFKSQETRRPTKVVDLTALAINCVLLFCVPSQMRGVNHSKKNPVPFPEKFPKIPDNST